MGSLVRSIAGRAMHMYFSPRPSNLGESREIMRLLSQFGEIEYYKSLKYEEVSRPRTALVIYKSEEAANECLRRSPIRFRMGKLSGKEESEETQSTVSAAEAGNDAAVPRGPLGAPFGLGVQTRSMSTSHSQVPKPPRNNMAAAMPFSSPPDSTPNADSSIFEIVVNRCGRKIVEEVSVTYYHGSFAIASQMVGQGDLARKVPTPGLSCVNWKHRGPPWHIIRAAKEDERSGINARKRLGELWVESGHGEAEEVSAQRPETSQVVAGEEKPWDKVETPAFENLEEEYQYSPFASGSETYGEHGQYMYPPNGFGFGIAQKQYDDRRERPKYAHVDGEDAHKPDGSQFDEDIIERPYQRP